MLTVALEVHVAIDADWRIDQMRVLHSDGMLAERENLKKFPQLYTLHVYDRLIVSLHHFSKHFLAGFLTYYYCPSNPLFDCKTLADAYFILLKYGDDIDSAALRAKARAYGFIEHIRFAAKMLSLLFGLEDCQKRLTESILNEPYASGETGFAKNFAAQTLYAATEAATGLPDKMDTAFYKEVVCRCIGRNEAVHAKKEQAVPLLLRNISDHCVSDVRAQIRWNEEGLTFAFQTDVPFSYAEDSSGLKEGISVRIYNPDFDFDSDNAVRNLFVCFDRVDGLPIPVVTFNGAESFRKGSLELPREYAACDADLRRIALRIPWVDLKIDASRITFIGLEVMLYYGRSDAKPQVCFYSNASLPHHNPAKFGSLSFVV